MRARSDRRLAMQGNYWERGSIADRLPVVLRVCGAQQSFHADGNAPIHTVN